MPVELAVYRKLCLSFPPQGGKGTSFSPDTARPRHKHWSGLNGAQNKNTMGGMNSEAWDRFDSIQKASNFCRSPRSSPEVCDSPSPNCLASAPAKSDLGGPYPYPWPWLAHEAVGNPSEILPPLPAKIVFVWLWQLWRQRHKTLPGPKWKDCASILSIIFSCLRPPRPRHPNPIGGRRSRHPKCRGPAIGSIHAPGWTRKRSRKKNAGATNRNAHFKNSCTSRRRFPTDQRKANKRCWIPWNATLAERSCLTLFSYNPVGHSYSTLLRHVLVGHYYGALLWDTRAWQSCSTHLYCNSQGNLLGRSSWTL